MCGLLVPVLQRGCVELFDFLTLNFALTVFAGVFMLLWALDLGDKKQLQRELDRLREIEQFRIRVMLHDEAGKREMLLVDVSMGHAFNLARYEGRRFYQVNLCSVLSLKGGG